LSCRASGDGCVLESRRYVLRRIGGFMEPIRGRGDLLDGGFVVDAAADGSLLESRDPARDFEVSFTVATQLAHTDAAVAAARRAQRAWHSCGVETRKAYLVRLKAVFNTRSEAIAEAITRET